MFAKTKRFTKYHMSIKHSCYLKIVYCSSSNVGNIVVYEHCNVNPTLYISRNYVTFLNASAYTVDSIRFTFTSLYRHPHGYKPHNEESNTHFFKSCHSILLVSYTTCQNTPFSSGFWVTLYHTSVELVPM